jgi:hypothetical protein
MYCEGKLKLKSHYTNYWLIEVVTKAGMTVSVNIIISNNCNFFYEFKIQNISLTL